LAIPVAALGELRHPKNIKVNHVADAFTFDEHCGGKEMRRRRSPLSRLRANLTKLKRKITTPEALQS
jgi:hypothetical protein